MNKIKLYPESCLTQTCIEIKEIDESILVLGEDLLRIVIEANAFGLAAPQIGKNLRAIVVRDPSTEKIYYAINPTYRSLDYDDEVNSYEGCLSLPGLHVTIKRWPNIIVKYINVKNEFIEISCSGLLACIFQHEIDHLDGILLIDRMSNTVRKRNKGYFKQLEVLYKKELKKLRKQALTETSV